METYETQGLSVSHSHPPRAAPDFLSRDHTSCTSSGPLLALTAPMLRSAQWREGSQEAIAELEQLGWSDSAQTSELSYIVW